MTAILDWYSRYVIAWDLSTTLDNDFCIRRVEEALRINCPTIFNTDHGTEYTSEDFIQILESHSIQISMDGRGQALDNIMIERLWRTVKYEEVYLTDYADVSNCRQCLDAYFAYYNDHRKHSVLGRVPKDKYLREKISSKNRKEIIIYLTRYFESIILMRVPKESEEMDKEYERHTPFYTPMEA